MVRVFGCEPNSLHTTSTPTNSLDSPVSEGIKKEKRAAGEVEEGSAAASAGIGKGGREGGGGGWKGQERS